MTKSIILRFVVDDADPTFSRLLEQGVLQRVPQAEAPGLLRELLSQGVSETEARDYLGALARGEGVATAHVGQAQMDGIAEIIDPRAEAPEEQPEALSVPLGRDTQGVYYVRGTRVPLSALLEDYRKGAEADDLALVYPTVPLEDIHVLLSYYLRHRDVLDAYLAAQQVRAEAQRVEAFRRFAQSGLRERLLSRTR